MCVKKQTDAFLFIDPSKSAWVELRIAVTANPTLVTGILCLDGLFNNAVSIMENSENEDDVAAIIKAVVPLQTLDFIVTELRNEIKEDPSFNILTTLN